MLSNYDCIFFMRFKYLCKVLVEENEVFFYVVFSDVMLVDMVFKFFIIKDIMLDVSGVG